MVKGEMLVAPPCLNSVQVLSMGNLLGVGIKVGEEAFHPLPLLLQATPRPPKLTPCTPHPPASFMPSHSPFGEQTAVELKDKDGLLC